jgi:Ca2+-transporting ATPase
MSFHAKSVEETFIELATSENGLSSDEAKRRLKIYGENIISGKHKRTTLAILIDQFKNFILWLLFIAAGVAFLIGNTIDAIAILIACGISILSGFILEYKADSSLRALQALIAPNAVVIRNGSYKVIEARYLVPGDIMIVEEGAKVPADGRIIESHGLEVNEALLTGESLPIEKKNVLLAPNTPIYQRSNMVYSGTLIVKGRGKAVVTATGDKTEFGTITSTLSDVESEKTTMQVALDDLGKKVSILAFGIIIFFVVIGLLQGMPFGELAILAISLAVAAVPEGLLTLLTIILALGVRRMVEKKALVRSLHAVETIGAVTTLVVDKTGTITEGKFQLTSIYENDKLQDISSLKKESKALIYGSLCNTANITEQGVVGDEIDSAIIKAAISAGVDVTTLRKNKQVAFFPFDSEKKYMASIHVIEGRHIGIIKGAPESILARCSRIEKNGAIRSFRDKKESYKILESLTENGMRVIGIAYKEVRTLKEKEIEKDLVFLGFLAFSDRPRPEIKDTLNICKHAGISVIMLTGDNLKTAFSIGKEIGLTDKSDEAVEWSEINDLSEDELKEKLKKIKIVARSTPLAKLRIVETLIKNGEIIAVTGDGINDAPALKKAHVGVVMGSGSDVSKEAGKLILLDDNFATLVSAVEHGRLVFHNIISFIKFQFTTNFALLGLFAITFVGSFFRTIPLLLTPIQILFINIVMDGPPALALGFEKALTDVLKEKPRKERTIISKETMISIGLSTIVMLLVMVFVYLYYANSEKMLTAAFLTFSFLQLFNALNCRFTHASFYMNPYSNPYIFIAVGVMALLLVAIVYVEPLQTIFQTKAIELFDWLVIIVASAAILVFEEIRKRFFLRTC